MIRINRTRLIEWSENLIKRPKIEHQVYKGFGYKQTGESFIWHGSFIVPFVFWNIDNPDDYCYIDLILDETLQQQIQQEIEGLILL